MSTTNVENQDSIRVRSKMAPQLRQFTIHLDTSDTAGARFEIPIPKRVLTFMAILSGLTIIAQYTLNTHYLNLFWGATLMHGIVGITVAMFLMKCNLFILYEALHTFVGMNK